MYVWENRFSIINTKYNLYDSGIPKSRDYYAAIYAELYNYLRIKLHITDRISGEAD